MSDKQLASQIDNLQDQVARLQQMAALGELVGTTTHEFNNYLMTIINYAKIGIRHKDEESRDRAFQKIHDAAIKAALQYLRIPGRETAATYNHLGLYTTIKASWHRRPSSYSMNGRAIWACCSVVFSPILWSNEGRRDGGGGRCLTGAP